MKVKVKSYLDFSYDPFCTRLVQVVKYKPKGKWFYKSKLVTIVSDFELKNQYEFVTECKRALNGIEEIMDDNVVYVLEEWAKNNYVKLSSKALLKRVANMKKSIYEFDYDLDKKFEQLDKNNI